VEVNFRTFPIDRVKRPVKIERMNCCANCFGHTFLKEYVQTESNQIGVCDYCLTENAQILEVSRLATLFHNLMSMYVPADTFESGEALVFLVQDEWEVFDEVLDENTQESLLEDILNSDWDDDDGKPEISASDLYMHRSSQWFHTTHRENWEQFCYDVRTDPQTSIPFDEFIVEELSEFEEILLAGLTLFSARRGFILNDRLERQAYQGLVLLHPKTRVRAGRTLEVRLCFMLLIKRRLPSRRCAPRWATTCR
jgi:hypothetical protein